MDSPSGATSRFCINSPNMPWSNSFIFHLGFTFFGFSPFFSAFSTLFFHSLFSLAVSRVATTKDRSPWPFESCPTIATRNESLK